MKEDSEVTIMRNLLRFVLLFSLIAFSASLALASTPANCKPDFSACFIPENVLLQLPFLAIAGDVVVQDPNSAKVSDVFRILNNVVDTGAGTGLGDLAILISGDDSNRANDDDNSPLGDHSRYSANAVFLQEAASGSTSYLGNGTNYVLDTSAVPTSLTYTGDTRADAQHSAQLKARLTLRETGAALPNATLQFTLGSQSCSGTTDASGVATCSIVVNQAPGEYEVTANFAGISGADGGASAATRFLIRKPESGDDKSR